MIVLLHSLEYYWCSTEPNATYWCYRRLPEPSVLLKILLNRSVITIFNFLFPFPPDTFVLRYILQSYYDPQLILAIRILCFKTIDNTTYAIMIDWFRGAT